MRNFFQEPNVSRVLTNYLYQLHKFTEDSEFGKKRNEKIKLIINGMINHPIEWTENCQINIDWIGESFVNRLQNPMIGNKEAQDSICSMSFRFLLELYLSTKTELSIEFENARTFVLTHIDEFDSNAKQHIEYAIRDMPIAIIKQLSNSEVMTGLKDYIGFSEKFTQRKTEWDNELRDKEIRVQSLKETLDQYTTAFNFVGLYEGFDKLGADKNTELVGLLRWIKVLSVLIVMPIVAELTILLLNIKDLSSIRDGLLVSFLPSFSLVLISIYYFRVLLFNYRSVKYQITQIDLRKTLCRFIQSYVEYSGKIKTKENDPLVKFEHIIFSEISGDLGSLPSTYDGIEQFGKLIDSLKSR